MVDLLLDFSRMQYGQLSIEHDEVDIAALMRGLVESMLAAVEGHVLRHSIPETPAIVMGDELRLQQIVQNLVQNAAKYSEPGSAIDVEVKLQDQQVAIAVADQGIGIAAEEIPHLFDEFYRSSSAGQRKGLGLGLYVVKQLVALHGGTIEVVSEVGRGSTFTVCLPLAIGTGAPDNEVPEQGTT
jgi:signal transduction histidine kinase